jgi:DNA-binding response OmpR family regulator
MAGGTVGATVAAVDFRILGPLEVWYEGRPIPVPGAKQRALLAMLLLDAGHVVSSDRLMEELWGSSQPAAGATALRVRVSQLLEQAWDENVDPFTNTVKVTIARLRRKLGEPDPIRTTPGVGYRIIDEP